MEKWLFENPSIDKLSIWILGAAVVYMAGQILRVIAW